MNLQSMKKTLAGFALSLSIAGFAMPAHAEQTSSTYVTGANDTFWKVSRKLGISVDELMAANPSIHPLNVYQGLTLTVPKRNTSAAAVNSSKVIQAVATAYSEAPEENGGWGGLDYFGNPLKIGTIAVDPNVIPLGTKVYITGYTALGLPLGGLYATATDVGSAIKGNRVDIFLPSSIGPVADFGIQNVQITIIK